MICEHWPPHTPAYWCIVDDAGGVLDVFTTRAQAERARSMPGATGTVEKYDDPNPCGDEA